ncbi:NAD(P)-binding domain-containing protein [Anaeromyxobacter sp. PSR-1]|uniref:NAD(P)-binding domain-containing protein n=1 Tax=Anaeromyxobacter sp. PSR-1 TaxID=1300915 RepID=UPI0005E16CE2|nr:NAD(P)-binding domain-containing protein [Anaeromyxobacter sp. PSR-1]GAO04155.1 hypothetical protein PSR1_03043 [Anaeromyxobacter sp. PSR-1]
MPSAYVLGAGRLASAVVPGLRAAGWRVAGGARTARGRARLRRLGAEPLPLDRAAGFDLVLLAVPDSVIEEVVRASSPTSPAGRWWRTAPGR